MADSLIQTRKASDIWLIGSATEQITGMKLPTCRQVLALFFYNHKIKKMTLRESSRSAIREVLKLWAKARIPTTEERNAIEKIEKLFDTWSKLKKNSKRQTETQKANENSFQLKLDTLFDIAHANAMALIKIEEDRLFLTDQRGERIGYMAGIDLELSRKEERSAQRKLCETERKLREEERKRKRHTLVTENASDYSETSESDEDCTDFDANLNAPGPSKRRKPISVMSSEIASALDRTNITDREATLVIAATVQSLGQDVSGYAISRSTIRRARIVNRVNTFQAIRTEFDAVCVPLTIHWDGKIMPDITGQDSVDRLPILVTGQHVEQLLGVPKLSSGTGESISEAVVNTVHEWDIADKVCAMAFDTTAANTGRHSGACHLIEQKLGKDLLHLACRHHFHEVILGDVFKHCLGPSSGPEISLFKRFRGSWKSIDKKAFTTALGDETCSKVLDHHQELRAEVLLFAKDALLSNIPRCDYRELLELTIIFLGDIPARGIRFAAPGAMHRARWMAKIIYSIKVWMFRGAFKLTAKEERSLRDLSLFGALLYTKAWTSASNPIEAPLNDFILASSIAKYTLINEGISSVAKNALSRHLWYLGEELVALSFFDNRLGTETKQKMIDALLKPGTEATRKRATVNVNDAAAMNLEDFVTENTLQFFRILGLPVSFLSAVDPKDWTNNEEYKQGRAIAESLKVVNDTAERGVKLIQDFNSSLTKNEEQKQYLLQVVKAHRLRFRNTKKPAFNK